MKAKQIDVNNVFIKLKLKERIYIKTLDDIRIKKGYILLIRKSLYKLKQAAFE